jgi:ArsR family transcriptional regulator, lead/cadmium/zinc/bismuth-responsive transcriptional repressor
MHRVPAESLHRVIDADTVCDAIAVLGDGAQVRAAAARFDLLSDPTRLALLVCIHRTGPISVSDLAVATGAQDATVSQSLKLLRDRGAVTSQRDGRVMRYTLADPRLADLVEDVSPPLKHTHQHR